MKKLSLLLMTLCCVSAFAQKPILIYSTYPENYAATQLDSLLKLGGCQCRHLRPADENKGDINVATCTPQMNKDTSLTIYVGLSIQEQRGRFKSLYDSLQPDGYAIIGNGKNVHLFGKGDKGTLYAVYAFLEQLGYRLYTPDDLVVPDLSNNCQLSIINFQLIENPAFEWREVSYYYPNHSQLYADWHHLHTMADRNSQWGMYVHTFQRLIPPSRFFDSHPEWFSLNNGRRSRDGQLCLSNPEVLEVLCRQLDSMITANPQKKIWSVSPNDNYNACQCGNCRHLDSIYGGKSGTLLWFVNQVARRFPDKTIATLAYQYTRKAPTIDIKPDSNVAQSESRGNLFTMPSQSNVTESNVLIMLCPIEAGREAPIYQTDPAFKKDMENWAKLVTENGNVAICVSQMDKQKANPSNVAICVSQMDKQRADPSTDSEQGERETSNVKRQTSNNNYNSLPKAANTTKSNKGSEQLSTFNSQLFIWDYVVQFRNFWNPFPNLHVLQPNLQYFRDNGVTMMFEQATGANNITSWMDIRCYMIAKLLWNPDANMDSIMADFYQGYYGDAGRYVKAVIDTMTAALIQSGQHLDIYGYPIDGCFSTDNDRTGYLWPSRMEVYYELMRQAYSKGPTAFSQSVHERLRFFEMALDFASIELKANDMYGDFEAEDMTAIVDSLIAAFNHFDVKILMEMGVTPNEYGAMMRRWCEKTFSRANAWEKPVSLRKPATAPFNAASLTDGEAGIMDYRHNWLGFWGDTLDAVIDLGVPTEIHEVSLDFYFFPLSWIFLPQSIAFYVSDDGKQWQLIGVEHPVNPEILATPNIHTYTHSCDKAISASLIRVIAYPIPEIPVWHRAAGQKPWIFTDEIIVK